MEKHRSGAIAPRVCEVPGAPQLRCPGGVSGRAPTLASALCASFEVARIERVIADRLRDVLERMPAQEVTHRVAGGEQCASLLTIETLDPSGVDSRIEVPRRGASAVCGHLEEGLALVQRRTRRLVERAERVCGIFSRYEHPRLRDRVPHPVVRLHRGAAELRT